LLLALIWLVADVSPSHAVYEKKARFTPRVVDYQHKLSGRFSKVKRQTTKYIIVHTSEGGLQSTLRTVSLGKCVGGVICSTGGHAHYVISREGVIYRMLNNRYVAHHAGLSMWNGERNLNQSSIGIELVGYHYGTITPQQYKSLSWLIGVLEREFKLDDKDVLTHAQIAYSGPNRWFREPHRGRKRCAKNFDRRAAGLRNSWNYDPDVRTGLLDPDPQLASIFYGKGLDAQEQSNVISKTNTAWSIAGEDYDSPETAYELPNGKFVRGDKMASAVGWDRIPVGTKLHLNMEPEEEEKQEGPIKTLTEGVTAWSLAGAEFNDPTTKYFLPGGRIMAGHRLKDWDNLPVGTRMIMGYKGPYSVGKNRYPKQIAGDAYKNPETIYFLSNQTLKSGSEIDDFANLPRETYIFVKIK